MKKIQLIPIIILALTLPVCAQVIIDPLGTAGDFDGTVTDDLAPDGTFSGAWLNTGGRNVGYGSNSFPRLTNASDQFIRMDRRRNIALDTGYTTVGTGEIYDLSTYTIAAAASVVLDTDQAQLTLYYTVDDTLEGTIGDSIDLTWSPTSTTTWDFVSISGAAFGSDPGAGKTLFLGYSVLGGANDANIGIDNVSLAVVPEPSTVVLLGLALGTLCFLRRRS